MSAVIFDDFKSRDVSGIDFLTGRITIYDKNSSKLVQRQLIIGPRGELGTRAIEPIPIDQTGEKKVVPIEQRWAMTDQGSELQGG